MKKYIFGICCMVFAGQVFAQPQTFFVHKKDGSVVELPVGPTEFDFTGKAVVNDGDYIQIENIEPVVAKGIQPYAHVKTDPEQFLNIYGIDYERTGICYAVESGVTVLNGNVIEISKEEYQNNYNYRRMGIKMDSLAFNSTYYCRSFIYWRGKYYYSKEYSFTTGKLSLEWYGLAIPESFVDEGIYVHPTDAAWEHFYTKHALSFNIRNEKSEEERAEIMTKLWNEEYLTIEKAKELAKTCTVEYDCEEGIIYLLDEIGDDFMNLFGDFETVMYDTIGLQPLDNKTVGPYPISCPMELDVPNNTYYEFRPRYASVNPSVTYKIDELMLANKGYELEVVMAPECESDSLKFPNKIGITYSNSGYNAKFESNIVTSATECTYIKWIITPAYFGQNTIEIESNVSNKEAMNDTAVRTLRIARISVRPIKRE